MSINWFTIIAQIINFGILVFILKKLLYQKILDILAERKRQVFQQLKDAEEAKRTAEQMASEYAERLNKLEDENAHIVQAAKDEIAAERERILAETQQEAELNRSKWIATLNREKDEFVGNITGILVKKIGNLVRGICFQLNGEELATHSLEAFFQNFSRIEPEHLAQLNARLTENAGVLTFITSAPLEASLQANLIQKLHDLGVTAVQEISYEVEENLVLGVEIRVGSTVFSWSVRDYLRDFDTEFKKLIMSKN